MTGRARSWDLGVDEVSGFGWRRDPRSGATELVVLCERTSDLLVISPDFRFERRIGLRHPWRGDRQAGLEALLLLTNGHVLAAKQPGTCM